MQQTKKKKRKPASALAKTTRAVLLQPQPDTALDAQYRAEIAGFEKQIDRQARTVEALRILISHRGAQVNYIMDSTEPGDGQRIEADVLRAQNAIAKIELETAEESLDVMRQQLAAIKQMRGME